MVGESGWPSTVARVGSDQPIVIVVRTEDGREEALSWAKSRGEDVGTTVVVLFPAGVKVAGDNVQSVLLASTHGPIPGKAHVYCFGKDPPRIASSAASIEMNDVPIASTDVPMVLLRLTCVREFSDASTYGKFDGNPVMMPAAVLPGDMQRMVLRTTGAVTYPCETTCL